MNTKFKSEQLFAMQALQKNDYLMGIAIRNPQTLRDAVLNVATLGITLNPAERQCYLVPRKGAVVLDVSYIGLSVLATRSGSIKFVVSKIVRENDTFRLNGFGKEPTHEYEPFGKRGEIIGVYCVAKTHGDEYLVDHMTLERCDEIRDRTDSWQKHPNSGAWHTDKEEMMKKTIIKQASKLWPKVEAESAFNKAIEILNQHEGIDFGAEREAEAQRKEALRIEANAKRQTERDEKDFTINVVIKQLCSDLTAGMTANDKGKFMREHLGITAFDRLNYLEIDDLKNLTAKLEAMKTPAIEGGTSGTTDTNSDS